MVSIPKVITRSLAVCALLTFPVGCVLDLNKISSDLQRPKVIFDQPGAWRCDQQKATLPTATGKLEPCTVCTNVASTSQAVSINKTLHTAEPNGTVATCETGAFVSPATKR